jgi:hypothetical protein
VVRIKSKTGAIHVRFAKSAISKGESESKNEKGAFERTYNTLIESTTGQVHSEILHGGEWGETVVTANTGAIDVRVVPISDHPSRLETSTNTGLSKIAVEAPMHGTTLKNLTAVHKSKVSGMLDVRYPGSWEGKVHVWCEGTGHVDVRGDGLNFQGGGNDVYAYRGKDALKDGKTIEVVSEGTGLIRFKA